jgi:hypothetical protein
MTRPIASAAILATTAALCVTAGGRAAAQRPSREAPQRAAQSAPTPKTADGHPDLTGLWAPTARAADVDASGNITQLLDTRDGDPIKFERDSSITARMDPNTPIYNPDSWAKVQDLDDNAAVNDPSTYHCMPYGVPRMGPPAQIAQSPTQLIFLYQVGPAAALPGNTFRVIPTDGRPLPPKDTWVGTYAGQSVGHWEGDTMVIESVDFTEGTWLANQGYFHSTEMKVTERLRREGNTIRYQATVEDPVVLLKPWVMNPRTLTLNTDPTALIEEALPCSERDLEHLVTKEHH